MVLFVISLVLAFLTTYLMMPKFILFLNKAGIVGIDIQKKEKPTVAEMGGPAVIMGFLAGVFFYVWTNVFLYSNVSNLIELFAGITTILIITLVGIFDDLSVLLKKAKGHFKRIGLKQWQKPLLTLPAAIPLMSIMAGNTTMDLPFLGHVNFGILYPLLIVPIGIVGGSNAINMLAGMNGLEAGMGAVLLTGLGIYSYINGEIAASIIGLTVAAALLAFLKYNWYPAKIMPGDSVVYLIGATIATVAIIGNIERFAIIAFIPWFAEFILKRRSNFKAENFGVLQKDGTLKAPYDEIYSLTHVVMKMGRFNEKQVVQIFIALEIFFVLFAFAMLAYFK